MKKLLKPISLVVLFQFFALFAAGQFTCLFSDTAQNYIPFPDSGAVWHEIYWWQPSPFFL